MKRLLSWSFLLTFFAVPMAMYAAGIVPCDGAECQACHFVQLGKNILDWFILVMASIITLVFAIGGFKMVISGGNEGAVTEAKHMMTNAVVGFVILMGSYLIVDTVIKTFVNEGVLGPWNEIKCEPPVTLTEPTPPVTGTPPPSGACSTQCANIPQGISVKSTACSGGGPCTVSSEIAGQLTALDQGLDSAGVNWQITEAFPPTRTHQNACHSNGTCIDANFTAGTSPTPENVQLFISKASAAGMKAVYEVGTQAEYNALKDRIPAANLMYLPPRNGVPQISGAHFSVYKGGG